MKQVLDDFQQRLRKELPPKQTPLRWERELFQTERVKDKTRAGRPQSRGTHCQEVDNAISKSQKKLQETYQQSLEYHAPL